MEGDIIAEAINNATKEIKVCVKVDNYCYYKSLDGEKIKYETKEKRKRKNRRIGELYDNFTINEITRDNIIIL